MCKILYKIVLPSRVSLQFYVICTNKHFFFLPKSDIKINLNKQYRMAIENISSYRNSKHLVKHWKRIQFICVTSNGKFIWHVHVWRATTTKKKIVIMYKAIRFESILLLTTRRRTVSLKPPCRLRFVLRNPVETILQRDIPSEIRIPSFRLPFYRPSWRKGSVRIEEYVCSNGRVCSNFQEKE